MATLYLTSNRGIVNTVVPATLWGSKTLITANNHSSNSTMLCLYWAMSICDRPYEHARRERASETNRCGP